MTFIVARQLDGEQPCARSEERASTQRPRLCRAKRDLCGRALFANDVYSGSVVCPPPTESTFWIEASVIRFLLTPFLITNGCINGLINRNLNYLAVPTFFRTGPR